MRTRGIITGVLLILLASTAMPAQARIGRAVDGVQRGVYLESGVQDEDRASLEAVVRRHASRESIAIIVLAAPHPPPGERAREVLDQLNVDTVLLFTPDDFAVASRVRDSAEVDAALDMAGDAARVRDTAAAADAIMQALSHQGRPLWLIVLGLTLILLGVAAALWLRRLQRLQREDERAFRQEFSAVKAKLDRVADTIVDLRDDVEGAADPELTRRLNDLVSGYQDALWSLERVVRRQQTQRLDQQAEDMLFNLERLRQRLDKRIDR